VTRCLCGGSPLSRSVPRLRGVLPVPWFRWLARRFLVSLVAAVMWVGCAPHAGPQGEPWAVGIGAPEVPPLGPEARCLLTLTLTLILTLTLTLTLIFVVDFVLDLPSAARRADAGRRGCGAVFGAHSTRTPCHGPVRALCGCCAGFPGAPPLPRPGAGGYALWSGWLRAMTGERPAMPP